MHELFCFGLGEAQLLQGSHSCFCLDLVGPVIRMRDHVLLKAIINDAAQLSCASQRPLMVGAPPTSSRGGSVLLRATYQDYEALLRHVSTVRVLQAHVLYQDQVVVLDTVNSISFFAGSTEVQSTEILQAAEIFAGGFARWSRALASLKSRGVRIHVSWLLERDPTCATALQTMDSSIRQATCAEEISAASQPQDTILLPVDFHTCWWRKALHLRPIHMALVSPPCQPWSKAGKGEGLSSPDGLLVLQLAELFRVSSVKVVLLEEVDGFQSHKHFQVFYAAMRAAGFLCRWRASLQLGDVAPAYRRRYFMIWAREDWTTDEVPFKDCRLQAVPNSNFATTKAVFDTLPRHLLEPCILSPEVLKLYMSPDLLPLAPMVHARKISTRPEYDRPETRPRVLWLSIIISMSFLPLICKTKDCLESFWTRRKGFVFTPRRKLPSHKALPPPCSYRLATDSQ